MTEYVRSNYSDWNTDTIERRSKELGETAVDIWNFELMD